MTKWFDSNGGELTEAEALDLGVQETFSIDWEDKKIPKANCYKMEDRLWAVRATLGGEHLPRGQVRFDGQWYYPEDGIHFRETYFTSAALALVRH